MVNNSPVAASIGGIEAATHVTVVHDGDPYTFALSESGNNKNDVWLVIPNGATAARYVADSGTISLGALMDGLSVNPALLEELQRDTPKG